MEYSTLKERQTVFAELAADQIYSVLSAKQLHDQLDTTLLYATQPRRAADIVDAFKNLSNAIDFLKVGTASTSPAPVYMASIGNVVQAAADFARIVSENRDAIPDAFVPATPATALAAQPAPAAPRKR